MDRVARLASVVSCPCWRRRGLRAFAFLLAAALPPTSAVAQTVASQPWLDLSIPHPSVSGTPQADATFGWSMAMGELNGSAGDELVVTSFQEDVVLSGTLYRNLGVSYAYAGTNLAPWGSLVPTPETLLEHGRLFVSIGSTRANGARRAFVGGMGRDWSYACSPTTNQPNAGEIAEINYGTGGVGYHAPPFEPSGPCPPDVAAFGHSSAVGDIDGDGIGDLVIGAPNSENNAGRVYVFFGGTSFPSGWLAFKLSSALTATDCFGFSVAVADLDGDANQLPDAIVVGAPERNNGPGHVYVFPTSGIAGLGTSQVHPLTAGTDCEVLTESGGATGNCFGWVVYSFGDVGGPSAALDGFGDIGIHSEAGAQGGVSGVGSLSVLWGKTPGAGPLSLVSTTNAAKLQVPSGYTPTQDERVGRAAATVEWEGSSPSGIKKGLLVGSPDADVTVGMTTYQSAGRVFLYYVPITSSSGNAWATELLEPDPSVTAGYSALPGTNSRFGGWIVSGEYNSGHTGQQFVVSSRERTESGVNNVGRVYAFYRP
jgi:FG-GAP repeat